MPSRVADAALQKLQEYGERFMSSFDDDDSAKVKRTSGKMKRSSQSAECDETAATWKKHQVEEARNGVGRSISTGSHQREQQAGVQAATAKENPKHRPYESQPGSSSRGAPEPRGPPAGTGGAPRKRSSEATDEIDAIMRAGKGAKQAQAKSGKGSDPALSVAAASTAATAGDRQSAVVRTDVMRRERKLFMSHKASKVHEAVEVHPAQAAGAVADGEHSLEEFQNLQLEVEKFAAAALDKKSAKLYKARMLSRLGAKPNEAPRTAASIGKGLAKVAAKRQALALEEAIETGMLQRKGLGRKKRAVNAKNRDRGLMEAGPSFKNGVLRVRSLKKITVQSGKLRLPRNVMN